MTKASPKTEVRNFVEDALRRFSVDSGRALGRQDQARYEYPSCTIILQGETNLTDAWARYAGELGAWTVSITRHGARVKNLTPILVDPTPVQRPA